MRRKFYRLSSFIMGVMCLGGCIHIAEKSTETTVPTAMTKEEFVMQSSSLNGDTEKESSTVAHVFSPIESKTPDTSAIETEKIGGIAVGKKHKLAVRGQVQEVWHYCAPTTVSMMLEMRGVQVSQHVLAKEMGTYEPFGTHNKDTIRRLNAHLFGYEIPSVNQPGYRLETVTNVSESIEIFKERVKQNINDGYPMYYTFDVSKIYPGKRGEHNVVGTGYIETSDGKDIAYLYYMDPSATAQDSVYGGLKLVTPAQLLEAMLTCEEPNYGW